MLKSEMAKVLVFVHSVQGGEPTDLEVEAWFTLVGDVDYDQAMDAATEHFKTESRRLWPADIRRSSAPDDIRDGFLFRNGRPVIGGPRGMSREQYEAWQDVQEGANG
jgi:hypothetical protein